jgi:transcription initiation factor TFIIH subunit 2
MAEKDLLPTRLDFTCELACKFIVDFFDQNPLSHVAIVGIKDGTAVKWCEFSGNPNELVAALKVKRMPVGEPSIQNALELSRNSLQFTPDHISREILVLYGSLKGVLIVT